MPNNRENQTVNTRKYVTVNPWRVDIGALAALQYRCDPALCRDERCCCSVYDAWADVVDVERMENNYPRAAAYLGRDFRPESLLEGMRWVGAGYVLGKNERGECRFSYHAEDGRLLCSFHSAALEAGDSWQGAKPRNCVLWPLTLTGEGHRTVSVQEDAWSFPCCRRRKKCDGDLDLGTASLIRDNFGEGFLRTLKLELGRR